MREEPLTYNNLSDYPVKQPLALNTELHAVERTATKGKKLLVNLLIFR